jgi:hypothetical protein
METALEKEKVLKKRKQVSWSEEKTSAVEKALVKTLKASKKLALKESQSHSSGLGVVEKATSVKSGTKKWTLTFVTGDKVCYVSTCVSTFIDTSSSVSRGPRLLHVILSPLCHLLL